MQLAWAEQVDVQHRGSSRLGISRSVVDDRELLNQLGCTYCSWPARKLRNGCRPIASMSRKVMSAPRAQEVEPCSHQTVAELAQVPINARLLAALGDGSIAVSGAAGVSLVRGELTEQLSGAVEKADFITVTALGSQQLLAVASGSQLSLHSGGVRHAVVDSTNGEAWRSAAWHSTVLAAASQVSCPPPHLCHAAG